MSIHVLGIGIGPIKTDTLKLIAPAISYQFSVIINVIVYFYGSQISSKRVIYIFLLLVQSSFSVSQHLLLLAYYYLL